GRGRPVTRPPARPVLTGTRRSRILPSTRGRPPGRRPHPRPLGRPPRTPRGARRAAPSPPGRPGPLGRDMTEDPELNEDILISIIIVTYNSEGYLGPCLESVSAHMAG